MKISFLKSRSLRFSLIFIIILGGFLRFYAVNWDSYGAFHPDERNISWAVTRITFFSRMNPKFFAYGGLPIYLYRGIGEVVVKVIHDPVWLADWGHIAVIGRYVSAVLSTISIFLIYLAGSLYFTSRVGFLSALLLAFSPWAVQQAHFSTTETMLVFFLLLLLILSRKILIKRTHSEENIKTENLNKKNILSKIRQAFEIKIIFYISIVWGLALAAKTTSVLFGVIPVTAIILSKLDKFQRPYENVQKITKSIVQILFLGIITSTVFLLFSPYTMLNFKDFYTSMTYESGVALGRFSVPYTLQFLHTAPYVYQLVTMLWQTGPIAIIGIAGLISLSLTVLPDLIGDLPFFRKTKIDSRLPALNRYAHALAGGRGNDKGIIVFLIFPVIYFGWVGSWYAKFSRYNVPLLPFLTVAAAWFMVFTLQKIPKKSFYWYICLLAYWVIGLLTFVWCLANVSVYVRPQTRIAATEWIFSHIPGGAHIYTEHWNDGLPLDIPSKISYNRELLTVYDEDNAAKKIYYADKLSTGDFMILSTRRIWATMPELGDKYPLTKLFYAKLLDGSLGYKEVATFTSYPQLFGLIMNDDGVEESIQVFDHPTVRIFQNTGHFSRSMLLQQLNP